MTQSILTGMGSAAMLAICGIAVFFISRAATSGKIGRNQSVGIRTRWTLASDSAWEAGHRAGGRSMSIGALGMIVGAVLGFASGFLAFAGVAEAVINPIIAACIIGACVWLVSWALYAAVAANRAARAVEA